MQPPACVRRHKHKQVCSVRYVEPAALLTFTMRCSTAVKLNSLTVDACRKHSAHRMQRVGLDIRSVRQALMFFWMSSGGCEACLGLDS